MNAGRGRAELTSDASQQVLKTLRARGIEREREMQKREVHGRGEKHTIETVSRSSAKEWADESDSDIEDTPIKALATASVKESRNGAKLVDI
jgi:hypothetical protein